MRSSLSTVTSLLAAPALLAVAATAQGTAYYIPDNVASAGACNVIPFGSTGASASWANQRYQTVIPGGDLANLPGLITSIGFAPCASSAGTHHAQHMTITLAHVPPGFLFSNGNLDFTMNLTVHGTGTTVVLDRADYSWEKTGDTWSSVGFDQSFFYNGMDDLLIDLVIVGNDNGSASGSLHRDTRPRLYATGWSGTPPQTGSTGSAAAKIQVQVGCADVTTYGGGCGGLELSFSGSAAIGSTLNVNATGGGASSPIALNIGGMNSTPFPVDTTPFGIPGCWILNDSLAAVATQTDAQGAATIPVAIPPGFNGYGLRLFHQFVHIDLNAAAAVSASNGGRSVIGPACP